MPGPGLIEFGHDAAQDVDIVAALQRRREDERRAFDFPQHIFQFMRPVGGVDVDEDQARLGARELGENPFEIVGRPDAETLAGAQPYGEEAFGKLIGPLPEFGIGQPDILVPDDDGGTVRIFFRDLVQMPADRIADEKLVACTMHITGNRAGLLHFRSSQTEDDARSRCIKW